MDELTHRESSTPSAFTWVEPTFRKGAGVIVADTRTLRVALAEDRPTAAVVSVGAVTKPADGEALARIVAYRAPSPV